MANIEYHGLLKSIDENDNIKVLYPKTYSTDIIMSGGGSLEDALNNKQDKTDNSLNTTAKTVTSAINEINSNLVASDNTKFEFTKSGDSYGYKDANGAFVPFKKVQASKTVTAGTSAITVVPDAGNDGMKSVIVNPTPSQSKSVTPSTSAQTVTPDSGKLLSSVSVSAISTQSKSASPSTSAQTITPDAGKLLSSVSISAMPLPDTVAKWADNTLNIVEGSLGSRGACTDGVTRSVFEIPQGKYYGGRSARDLIGVTDDKIRQLGWRMENVNSSEYSSTYIGRRDLGVSNTYRYVSVNPYIYLGMLSLICYSPTTSAHMTKIKTSYAYGYFNNIINVGNSTYNDLTTNTVTVSIYGSYIQFRFTISTTYPRTATTQKNLTSVEVYNSVGSSISAFYCLGGNVARTQSLDVSSDSTWHTIISNVEYPICDSYDFGPANASDAHSCIDRGHIFFGATRTY